MCTCITTCNVQCAVKVIVANGNCSTSHGPTTREHTMAQLLSLDITLLHPLTYDSFFSYPYTKRHHERKKHFEKVTPEAKLESDFKR